ncbi:MAG: septal ring factor EnvC (AmiA/AmiB activator), partial [Pseudohongiellaceae bacterium]
MSWSEKLAIGLVFSMLSALATPQSTRQSDAAESELQSVGTAIEEIQSWLSLANQTASVEEAAQQEAAAALSAVSASIKKLTLDIDQITQQLSELRAHAASLENQKADQAQSAATVIRAVYKRGTANPLKSLMSQNTLNRDSRLNYYARVVSAQQLAKIQAFETTLVAIAQNQAALAAGVSDLNLQQQQLTSQRGDLLAARQHSATVVAQLRSRIKTRADELEQLEMNQAELQRLIEEIR